MDLKKFLLLVFSISSGIMLALAWPTLLPSTFAVLIFFGFVPLLTVAKNTKKKIAFFSYAFITHITWNALTTWWIWNSTDVGSIAAITANALLMCLPWWGYFTFKNKFGKKIGYISLISFWMMFEYIHLNWQLTWPWLTLGNAFATNTNKIQWYEYTGVSGGTLWILLTNILLFEIMQQAKGGIQKIKGIIAFIFILSFPIIISAVLLINSKKDIKEQKNNVLIIQPNIDPYQKFESISIPQQIQKLITLSESELDSATKLILWPETALAAGAIQNQTRTTPVYQPVFDFVNRHPNITLLSGIENLKVYGTSKETGTARKTQDGIFYDEFNSAVVIKANQPLQFYNKSKLVPGVESLPSFLNFMSPLFEHFGGTTGGYGRDTAAKAFYVNNNPYIAAPIICYESIYGEYVTEYVKRGANILTIVTNDGWWGNTPGHKQHLQYARLRAIETRRYVARSANTGISAVIDEKGNILRTQPWDKVAVIKFDIPVLTGETFYVRFGDYLYKLASLISILLLSWNLFLWIKNKIAKKN